MEDTFAYIIIGGMWAIIQAGFWLWVRQLIRKHEVISEQIKSVSDDIKTITKSISNHELESSKEVSAVKLHTANNYISKPDMQSFIERNDKVQSELKSYLMAIHDR